MSTPFKLPALPDAAASELAYISGINSDGSLAATSYWTYENTVAHKWGADVAGTGSGVITYSFSGLSSTQQATLTECLSLWSSVCNVSFQEVDTGGAFTLQLGTDKQAITSDSYLGNFGNGGGLIATTTNSTLSIDPTVSGFELDGSFTTVNGYGLGTAIHEIGHALGLGHGGPYNGSVTPSTQQFSPYDSRLWSVMSYIQPSDTSAKYYSSYAVQGSTWQGAQTPTTMMPLDILAVQELYGTPTSTNLAGGQTFGFHTNIADSIRAFYDFTVNTKPVVTIWDGGTGNTLDLSGYSTDDVIDLRPGMFSSVNGLSNDIGIAFNTRIDSAVGGSGNDTFYVNDDSDVITGGSGRDTVVFSGESGSYTMLRSGDTVTVSAGAVMDTLNGIASLQFADTTIQTSSIACFVRGTRIAVPGGETAVEALASGDLVLTAAGLARPVRWIGTRSYAGRFLAANPRLHPVRIRAGALGVGLPRRDLLVSPSHAMLLDGVLVPAACLVDGASIVLERGLRDVDYFHVELDTHDVILAEGAATESFVDCDSRGIFQNAATFTGPAGPAGSCAPRLEAGHAVEAIRRRLRLIGATQAA